MARIGRRNVLAKYHNLRRRRYHIRKMEDHNATVRTGEKWLRQLNPPRKYK